MIANQVLKLPKTTAEANFKYHSVVVLGLLIFYLAMYLSWKLFLQPNHLQIIVFFYSYLAFVVPIKCIFSVKAQKASFNLRRHLPESTPKDIGREAPLGANSRDPAVLKDTSIYWTWNLFTAFFSGATLAWMFGLFFVFLG